MLKDNNKKNKHTASQKTRGFLFSKCTKTKEKKGCMQPGLAVLPYSRKALKMLAETLKIHRSMVWLDPNNNKISIKKLSSKEDELDSQD